MHTLRAMQIIWPSAGRALELFRGAKDDPSGGASDLVPLTKPSSVMRHKRSAEQLLDDSFVSHRSTSNRFDDMHPVSRTNTQDQQQQQQQQQSNFPSGLEGYTRDNYLSAISTSVSLPSLTGTNMVPSSYAWQGGGMNTNNLNTQLSAALLPQMYSTGLVDENIRIHSDLNQSTNPSSRRYPPYYDYSTFSPLGSAYDIREPIQVSQPQPQASQMYIPESYSIYSMWLPSLSFPSFFFFSFLMFSSADSQFSAR